MDRKVRVWSKALSVEGTVGWKWGTKLSSIEGKGTGYILVNLSGPVNETGAATRWTMEKPGIPAT